jgi:hypothetical protein
MSKFSLACLQAILSDTLNLRSPTTTEWDRKVVSMLVQYTGVADVNLLCAQQFKSKSRTLATMSAYALCEGDLKQVQPPVLPASFPLLYPRLALGAVRGTTSMTASARHRPAPRPPHTPAWILLLSCFLSPLPPLLQFKLGAPDGSLVRVAFAVVETTDANTMLVRRSLAALASSPAPP